MYIAVKKTFDGLLPARRAAPAASSLRFELAFRQTRLRENRFNVLEKNSFPYYFIRGQRIIKKFRPKRQIRRNFWSINPKNKLLFRPKFLYLFGNIPKKQMFPSRKAKFLFAMKQANYRQTKKRKYYSFSFYTYDKYWQSKHEQKLKKWFFPFGNQYYNKFKRIAAQFTVNNTQTFNKKNKKLFSLGEPALLFFLKDLWPFSPISFFLAMLKTGVCLINGKQIFDPFCKISQYDVFCLNISPVCFITFILLLNKISQKTYSKSYKKTHFKKLEVSGIFSINYKTMEMFLLGGEILKTFDKKKYSFYKNNMDYLFQQFMYKKQRKFGLNRK